jgi:hypothetical protein
MLIAITTTVRHWANYIEPVIICVATPCNYPSFEGSYCLQPSFSGENMQATWASEPLVTCTKLNSIILQTSILHLKSKKSKAIAVTGLGGL